MTLSFITFVNTRLAISYRYTSKRGRNLQIRMIVTMYPKILLLYLEHY